VVSSQIDPHSHQHSAVGGNSVKQVINLARKSLSYVKVCIFGAQTVLVNLNGTICKQAAFRPK